MKKINSRYEKIYDPRRDKFYYYDKETDTSSWKKPALLLHRDIETIAQTYTEDQAATMIQTRIRMVLSLLRVRILYQSILIASVDEGSGYNYYYNPRSEVTMWDLPYFMSGRLDYERKKARVKPPKVVNRKTVRNRKGSTAAAVEENDSDNSEPEGDNANQPQTEGEVNETTADDLAEGGSGEGEQQHDDQSTTSGLSDSSDAMREKRRLLRNYPRSKVQLLVDEGEDHVHETTQLDLSHINATRFTSRLYDLDALTHLDLSHNRLAKLSADIQYLSNLTVLDVSHNRLETLPKEMGEELHALTDLDVSHNALFHYPGQIYKMKRLTSLNLSHNQLKAIPVETGNLELLKDLGQWDVGVGLLQQLMRLNVSWNKLSEWPPQVDLLLQLQHLDLSHNSIALVPPLVGCLSALTHLDLCYNAIASIPYEIYELPRLNFLALHENCLPDWAPCVSDPEHGRVILYQLNHLTMAHNQLTLMDRRMDIMRHVERLDVSHNAISRFIGGSEDDCLSLMAALTSLDMSHNALTEMTTSLGACVLLTHIDLSHNALVEIPAAFIKLTRLVSINLSHNRLAEASGKIFAMLNDLERLELQHNELAALPPLLYTLRKVSHMDLSHNRIPSLLDAIDQLVSMQHLNLSHNLIAELPAAVSALSQLTVLELQSNRITSLPVSISHLRRLRRVTLSHNDLTASPGLLSVLPQLLSSNLSWNARMQGRCVDYVSATRQHDPLTADSLSTPVLRRKLLALGEEVDRLSAVVRPRQPLYVHELPPSGGVNKDEEYALLMGRDVDEDDEDDGDTKPVAGRKAPPKKTTDGKIGIKKKKRAKRTPGQKAVEWHDRLRRHFAEHCLQAEVDPEAALLSPRDRVGDTLTLEALRAKESRQATLHLSFLLQRLDACRGYSSNCGEFLLSTPAAGTVETVAFDRGIVESSLEQQGGADWQGAIEGYQSLLHELNAMSLLQHARDMVLHPAAANCDGSGDDENQAIEQQSESHADESERNQISRGVGRSSSRSRRRGSSNRRPTSSGAAAQDKKLLTMAFGEVDPLEARGLSKISLMEGLPLARIPPILQYARVLDATVTALGGSRRHEAFDSSRDDFTSLVLACYIGLAKVLTKRAECMAESIRRLEVRGGVRMSCLDLAQRAGGGDDLYDLMADVHDDLCASIAAKEASRGSESLSQRKKKNVSSLVDSLLKPRDDQPAASTDRDADGDGGDESAAPATANDRLLAAGVDKMMAKDPSNNAATSTAAASPARLLSEILPPVNAAEQTPIDPVPCSTARGCIAYLSAQRDLTLTWASMCLDVAEGVLKLNGWDLASPSFSLHSKHQYSGAPDWLREGCIDATRLRAKVCQYLQLYSQSLEAYVRQLRLMKRVDSRAVLMAMARVHIAQGNYLLANKVCAEVVETYVMRPLGRTSVPDVFDLLRVDKELALLSHYAETCLDSLTRNHGVFSSLQSRVFRVQDNGLLSKPADYFAQHSEVRYGRLLSDAKRVKAAKVRKVEEHAGLELHGSRAAFRTVIDAEKERVRAALRALAVSVADEPVE